jgi:hypothetical protein
MFTFLRGERFQEVTVDREQDLCCGDVEFSVCWKDLDAAPAFLPDREMGSVGVCNVNFHMALDRPIVPIVQDI